MRASWAPHLVLPILTLAAGCGGEPPAPTPPPLATRFMVVSVLGVDGSPTVSALLRVSLLAVTVPSHDVVGRCHGVLAYGLTATTAAAGAASFVLFDYGARGDSLCLAIEASLPAQPSSRPVTYTLPLAPFRIDPSFGTQPPDTTQLILLYPPPSPEGAAAP